MATDAAPATFGSLIFVLSAHDVVCRHRETHQCVLAEQAGRAYRGYQSFGQLDGRDLHWFETSTKGFLDYSHIIWAA
jgi:hypothetical protein